MCHVPGGVPYSCAAAAEAAPDSEGLSLLSAVCSPTTSAGFWDSSCSASRAARAAKATYMGGQMMG